MVNDRATTGHAIVVIHVLLLATVVIGFPPDKMTFRLPFKRDSGMTNYEFATYMIRNGDLNSNGKMSRSEIASFFRTFIKVDQSTSEFVSRKLMEYGDVFNADGELDFMELLLALERVYD